MGLGVGNSNAPGIAGVRPTIISTDEPLTYNMHEDEQVVHVTTEDATAAVSLVLPPVGLAAGRIYMIYYASDGGSNLNVDDLGDATVGVDKTYQDTGDYLVLTSDGFNWFELGEVDS